MSPRALLSRGSGGGTVVATINPAFDRTAFRDSNDDLGSDEWTLASATATTLILGYLATLIDPAIHDYWYRVGMDFSFGSIPTSATITQVQFQIRVTFQDGTGGDFAIADKLGGGAFSAEGDPQTFWDECSGGTSYGTLTPSLSAPRTYTVTLNAAAVSAVQTVVTAGSGSVQIALAETGALDVNDVRRFLSSVDASSNKPALIVTYTTAGGPGMSGLDAEDLFTNMAQLS
jgi:hypothetical protein